MAQTLFHVCGPACVVGPEPVGACALLADPVPPACLVPCSTHAAQKQRIPEAAVWTYLLQVARGLQHLHRWAGRVQGCSMLPPPPPLGRSFAS